MTTPKMKVEVWTDIMCPYCYIGKIHYEKALARFEHAHEVELIIKSFQLNPSLPDKGNGYPVIEYLTKTAGYPKRDIDQMFDNLKVLANNAGVKFNLQNSVAANTLDAHRLIKLAASQNIESEVMTAISKAYFEDALDYSNIDILVKIGTKFGLAETTIRKMLDSDQYKDEVLKDIAEAHTLNIDTVPTFLFERKRAIRGAESVDIFLTTLKKSHSEWKQSAANNGEIEITKGKACPIDGVCEI